MALQKPAGTGKKEQISLDSAATHLLEECRMVLPGIQALFGFQLIAVFNQGFGGKLSQVGQMVHLVALILTTLSMALVMTPAALHRQVGLDSYVVASIVLQSELLGAVLGVLLMLVFASLWFVLPRRERRSR